MQLNNMGKLEAFLNLSHLWVCSLLALGCIPSCNLLYMLYVYTYTNKRGRFD